MWKRYLGAAGVMVLAALLALPETSQAQFRGRFGGGYGMRGYGGGGYGLGLGTGYGGWGNSMLPGYGGYGFGWGNGYGYGGYGPYAGYGYGYPSYSYGYPSYGYNSGYVIPPYTYSYPANYSPVGAAPSNPNPHAARVLVQVPDPNAQVLFDGNATRQKGSRREFVTDLPPGQMGTYTVTARWTENGQRHEETRQVNVRPGQSQTVDFNQAPATAARPQNNARPVRPVRNTPTNLQVPTEDRVPVRPANADTGPRDDSLNRNPGNVRPAATNPNPKPRRNPE